MEGETKRKGFRARGFFYYYDAWERVARDVIYISEGAFEEGALPAAGCELVHLQCLLQSVISAGKMLWRYRSCNIAHTRRLECQRID